MTALALLRDDLARAFDGDPWHGPPLRALLDRFDAAAAAAHPVPVAHSAWEIALHLASWMRVGTARVASRAQVDADPARDWPAVPVPSDAAAWAATLDALDRAHAGLLAAVDGLHEADLAVPLGPPVGGTAGTLGFLLAGLAQHAAYHGGQLALLAKTLG